MLILVRHGRTQANARRLLQGRNDLPLDEIGRGQARSIRAALGQIDRVIASPLQRAGETAEALGLPFSIDPRWTELDYGEWEARPITEVSEQTWQSWRSDLGFTPPGGESLRVVSARVREACEELLEEATQKEIVVVTHVSPIKAAICWALGAGDELLWRMFLSNASISRIGFHDGQPVLHGFNQTEHLPPR